MRDVVDDVMVVVELVVEVDSGSLLEESNVGETVTDVSTVVSTVS